MKGGDTGCPGKTSICGAVRGLLAGVDGALDERVDKELEPGVELEVDVLGTGSVHADEREVDLRLSGRRKLDLGLPSGLADTLNAAALPEISTPVSFLNSARMTPF